MKHLIAITVVSSFLMSCGKGQDRKQNEGTNSESSSSLASDSEIAQASVESIVTDSYEAMVEQGGAGSSLLLNGSEKDGTDSSVYNRACEQQGDNAVVTISTEMNRAVNVSKTNMTMSRTISGSSKQTRTWSRSKDGATVAVACGSGKKAAAIDWKSDIAGLKLDLSFERSRSHVVKMENKKNGKSFEHSRSFSASGTRSVVWGAVDSTSSSSDIVRSKNVTSSVNRKFKAKNKQGEEKEVELTIKTKDLAPLSVVVERDSSTMALKKKTIKSGTLVATKNSDGRMESSFSNVVLTFDGKECLGESGSIETKIFAQDSEEPVKTLVLSIDQGVYTLKDSSSGEEKEVDSIGCDAEDFAD